MTQTHTNDLLDENKTQLMGQSYPATHENTFFKLLFWRVIDCKEQASALLL